MNPAVRWIGPNQKHVLLVLSVRGPSPATDWAAWYPATEGQVRGAIRQLVKRGLVDCVGFDNNEVRIFGLTDRGYAVVSDLWDDPESALDEEGS